MKTLVVAPHPDDELLGCGGYLLRLRNEGAKVGWIIATAITENAGWDQGRIIERNQEIQTVREGLGISSENLFQLNFPAARIDETCMADLVQRFSEVFQTFQPEQILVPHRDDVHSDHKFVFDAVSACCKWFRYPYVERVMGYETLSETEFKLGGQVTFLPNVFVDVSKLLEEKIKLFKCYKSENGEFPFPRSERSIRALASLRGSNSGFEAAEAFQMLRWRIK